MKRTTKTILWIGLALIFGVLIGRWTSGGERSAETTVAAEGTVWICSMHPQIRQDHPGTCPLCGMDLIPADSDDGDSGLPVDALKMSPTAMQLANVQTAFVGTGDASKDIRLTGKLTLDPRNSFVQTAYVPGRIERFYFGSLGEYVNKGAKIAELFSPELLDAQKELLLTHKNRENMPGAYEAVREKLRLWKISDNQIDRIIQTGKVEQNFPIYANQSGYLVEKQISAGDYVESGSPLFTISQFNSLWGVFNVYEKDVGFIKTGMPVTYTLPSMPGKEFTAKIDFVEPVLNAETRTLNARIVINNPKLEFKPEMLINANVQSSVSGADNRLIVPKSAVMWTGKKSVVYVKYTTADHIGFAMRPVVLGPALGDSYIVESGLEPGEEIVVQGTFSVDAAAQLANKPSMMNQGHHSEKIELPHTELSDAQQKVFQPFISKYFVIKDALVNDNFKDAKTAFVDFAKQWQQSDWKNLPETVKTALDATKQQDFTKPEAIENVKNVEVLRNKFFYDLSNFLITLTKTYHPVSETIYVQHCPMANNDKGADWLSLENEVLNPYYGASMLRCGEVRESL